MMDPRLFLLGIAAPLLVLSATAADSVAHTAQIQSDKLHATIADNEAFGTNHSAGYNGVAELRLAGDTKNLFVPGVAGLNFEHIFSGDRGSFDWNIFEPRRAPMRLIRRSPTRVE